jgi:ubiquinone biosynthesis protein
MDFILEGQTAVRLRMNATPNEKIPRIHWSLSSAKVLTMDFIEGLSVAEASRLLQQQGIGVIRSRIADFVPEKALHTLAFASLHQLFGTGFFHADPHPGNILLLDDNKIAFVDFGIFGILSDGKRELLAT